MSNFYCYKNQNVLVTIKHKLDGEIIPKLVGPTQRCISTKKKIMKEEKRAKDTKKYVLKGEIQFKDYQNCLKAKQFENINFFEKKKI